MLLPHGTVFAIVDGENFELYRNTGMEAEPQLTAIKAPRLENTNYSAAAKDHDKIARLQSGAPKDRLDKNPPPTGNTPPESTVMVPSGLTGSLSMGSNCDTKPGLWL